MTNKKSLLEFPCLFPIKVFGNNNERFIEDVIEITRKHFPDVLDDSIQMQNSKQNAYVAITITVFAKNQEILDSLYQELTNHPNIKMVL